MTKNVYKIDSNSSVLEACKLFGRHKVGSLVVKDKDLIVGILTERDVIESIILVNGDAKKTMVREIMSPNIRTVHALTPVEKAAQIMKEDNIKKLPVILNNEIVGIITETDLSRTITAYSEAIDKITEFYYDSREMLEKMLDDWGNMIINLKNYKRFTESEEIEQEKIEI